MDRKTAKLINAQLPGYSDSGKKYNSASAVIRDVFDNGTDQRGSFSVHRIWYKNSNTGIMIYFYDDNYADGRYEHNVSIMRIREDDGEVIEEIC